MSTIHFHLRYGRRLAAIPLAAAADADGDLVDLATKRFHKLEEADRILFAAIAEGKDAVFGTAAPEEDCPSTWPENRRLGADRLVWLCTDPEAISHVKNYGISVVGAGIDGDLNLHFARVPFPISLLKCAIPSRPNLKYAQVAAFELTGSRVKGLDAEGIQTSGALRMADGFQAKRRVVLRNAMIGGDVICCGGHFEPAAGEEGVAINLDEISINGNLVFGSDGAGRDSSNPCTGRFESQGRVTARAAKIRGDIDCGNALFFNPGSSFATADDDDMKSDSLSLSGANVGGDVSATKGFEARGKVNLLDAKVALSIDFSDGHFESHGTSSLSLDRVTVGGSVFLMNEFVAHGKVSMRGATIGGQFCCDHGTFINSNENAMALQVDETNVKQGVYLRKVHAQGQIRFVGGTFGSNVEFSESKIEIRLPANGSQISSSALTLDISRINGNVFLHGLEAHGIVRFVGTRIEGDLDCSGGKFNYPTGDAVFMVNIEVKRDLIFRQAEVKGRTNLEGSIVQGDLKCDHATFESASGDAIRARNLTVQRDASFGGALINGRLMLESARIKGQLLIVGSPGTELEFAL